MSIWMVVQVTSDYIMHCMHTDNHDIARLIFIEMIEPGSPRGLVTVSAGTTSPSDRTPMDRLQTLGG